jgi:hypothetical protein
LDFSEFFSINFFFFSFLFFFFFPQILSCFWGYLFGALLS